MTYRLIHYFIRIFYRHLRIPKKLIYNTARGLIRFLPKRFDENNIIQPSHTKSIIKIPKDLGYLQFSSQQAPELNQVAQDCTKLFNAKYKQYDNNYFISNPNKRFLLTIDADENLLKLPSIHNLITSDYIHHALSDYFTCPYTLSTIRLWWSSANDTSINSQLYHLDEEDLSQVKLLININNITEEHGPFTFLNAITSDKIISNFRVGKKKFLDEEVSVAANKSAITKLIGPSGSAAFVDTSRCLHYGSRGNKHDRLLLMTQFLKADAPLLQQSLAL